MLKFWTMIFSRNKFGSWKFYLCKKYHGLFKVCSIVEIEEFISCKLVIVTNIIL